MSASRIPPSRAPGRPKARVLLLTFVLTVTSLGASAAPGPGSRPPTDTTGPSDLVNDVVHALRDLVGPRPVLANFCASNAAFTGKLTQQLVNSGTPSTAARITTPTVYGWISNVDAAWSCTAYYRYSGVAWNTTTSSGVFDWGNLIASTSVACNFVVGTTDYIKGNGTATCPTSDTDKALAVTLTKERVYQASTAHTSEGHFSYAQVDCGTLYGSGEVQKGTEAAPVTFSTSSTTNRPGSNCDPYTVDSTGTSQTVTYDKTAPTLAINQPASGGPVVVPSAFYAVGFDATDAVAGFGGANGWSLQRQVATWSGTACGTFGNDGSPVTGTTSASNQVSGQSLALGSCYRWTLGATDQNGNTAATVTSGSIRTDTNDVLGDQPQFRTEGFDLGGGDALSVSTGSGNVRLEHPIVSLPIRAGTLEIGLAYNSHDGANVGVGPGWRLNVQRRLALNADNTVTFTDADGARHTFTNPTGSPIVSYTRPATLYASLTRDTGVSPNRFTLTYRDQSKDILDLDLANTGLLKQVKDRFGNTVSLAYAAGTDRITTITDPASRTISFGWTGSNLTSIVDWADVSGGIVQTSGAGNRTHRLFYDGSNNLIGWADPLNTSASCPTGGSHLTCLTYTAGLLDAITKTQTYETISANPGTLSSATRTLTTGVAYTRADVASVTDAEGATTTFSHPASGATKVVRPGTPASETTYTLIAVSDPYGRISSVKRKSGAAQIETLTSYDATYPIEPASVTEDNGGALQRTTSFTYQASSLALLSRLDEPLDGTYRRYTDYTYNANNDVTQKIVSRAGDAVLRTTTRYCYTTSGCATSATDLLLRSQIDNYVDGTAGNGAANVEDVTTSFLYDAYGQRTRSTRANYAPGGALLDSAATGWTYDTSGNVTAEIRNYTNGLVTNPGDDITPNATTNARTDLTTSFANDTAGNRVSAADPRRAIKAALGTSLAADDYISRTTYDALNQAVTTRLPTALDIAGQTDCSPAPACREATTTYDELGLVREAADINHLVSATKYDKAGRALETYESVTYPTAAITSINTYDAQGRLLTAKDREQAKTGATTGYSQSVYDELGHVVAQAWAVTTGAATETDYTFDSLGRQKTMTTGVADASAQTTTWTYDPGGRATKLDDEFTCTSTTYDYRDLAFTVVEGQASGSCSGAGIRTVTNTYDGLGRQTLCQVTAGTGLNDKLAETTYDGAGNTLTASATRAAVTTSTTSTVNPLDQTTVEVRSSGTWAKTNYDPAGSATDRCLWAASPTDPCKPAGSTFASPQPTSVTTSTYDGRSKRILLQDGVANTTTTYDKDHDYQVAAIYLPTANGREHQTLFGYDSRHRSSTITQMLCATGQRPQCTGGNVLTSTGSDTYAYDDNDNKTGVTEANGAGTLTRGYCYDAVQRVSSTRDATGCAGTSLEAYTYDASGNRKTAGGVTFTYNTAGQLASCTAGCGTVAYDAAGRTQKLNGWYFEYDAQGRLTWACQATSACTGGLYNELESTYDAAGHRTQLRRYASGNASPVATTDFRYQGDAIVEEKLTDAGHPAGAVVRSYVVDDAGSIVKLTVAAGEPGAGTYLVTWNGHGDATSLWRIEADGSLTLANSFTYSTWGAPTTATHNGLPDLGFRFLYVGQYDVQWDNAYSLGLAYMHARHYSPALGRFLQPDPDGSEANLYAYAADNPVTEIDPDGTCFIVCQIIVGAVIGAVVDTVTYLATTDSSKWNLGDAATAAAQGAIVGGATSLGIGAIAGGWRAVSVASRLSRLASTGSKFTMRAIRASRGTNSVVTRYGQKMYGREMSHWLIPQRAPVPNIIKNSAWNLKQLSTHQHALADPMRRQFMTAGWKAANTKVPNVAQRFWMRSPLWAQGGMGAAASSGSWAMSRRMFD